VENSCTLIGLGFFILALFSIAWPWNSNCFQPDRFLFAVLKLWNLNLAAPFGGRAKERWAGMKMCAVLLPLVALLCLLLAFVPAMAGPIPFSGPSGDLSMTDSVNDFGFPGPNFLSMLSSEDPTGLGLSGSIGSPLTIPSPGSYRLIGFGGGPPDPPTPAPASEPSGIAMVLSSGFLGVLGLCRRSLKI